MSKKQLINKGVKILKRQGLKEFTKRAAHVIDYQARTRTAQLMPSAVRQLMKVPTDEEIFVQNPIFLIDESDINKSKEVSGGPTPEKIRCALWFVPYFDHLAFGGIYTIFRFINHLQENGVHNTIVIYDNPGVDVAQMQNDIARSFPSLASAGLIIFDPKEQKVRDLPKSDIAFCTFWVSAYLLLKYNNTKRKYYFIQDYEPLFYTAGATYALAESTYRFGFRGIVNTPGLLAAINKRHGMEGISFIPAVDGSLYHPATKQKSAEEPVRIFFYARPNNPRNAFYLGVETMQLLKKKYKDRIEIITAGATWKERRYALEGKITNLGLLKSLPEVAELYRSCDIGFVYMLTKHPSYQPFEFMASGMATVTNNNEDNLWFLDDGKNCLLAEPSPKAMAQKIGQLVEDPRLRTKIARNGRKSINLDWPTQVDTVWNDIKNF